MCNEFVVAELTMDKCSSATANGAYSEAKHDLVCCEDHADCAKYRHHCSWTAHSEKSGVSTWVLLVVACCVLANFRGLDRFAGWRELNANASLKEHRLPVVRQRMMHDWAVLVALKMLCKTLCWTAPCHSANLFAGYFPIGEALEDLEALLRIENGAKVDERIAQASLRLEVDGQVRKVICACETHRVHQLQQHVPGVVVGHVTDHHCRPPFLACCACAGDALISRSRRWGKVVLRGKVDLRQSCRGKVHLLLPEAHAGWIERTAAQRHGYLVIACASYGARTCVIAHRTPPRRVDVVVWRNRLGKHLCVLIVRRARHIPPVQASKACIVMIQSFCRDVGGGIAEVGLVGHEALPWGFRRLEAGQS